MSGAGRRAADSGPAAQVGRWRADRWGRPTSSRRAAFSRVEQTGVVALLDHLRAQPPPQVTAGRTGCATTPDRKGVHGSSLHRRHHHRLGAAPTGPRRTAHGDCRDALHGAALIGQPQGQARQSARTQGARTQGARPHRRGHPERPRVRRPQRACRAGAARGYRPNTPTSSRPGRAGTFHRPHADDRPPAHGGVASRRPGFMGDRRGVRAAPRTRSDPRGPLRRTGLR